MNVVIHTDGGSRGNPGPAAIGVVIERGNNVISEFGKPIGETTNNVAEYTAVIEALTYVLENNMLFDRINFYLDSMLIVNQINGVFKVKQMHLFDLLMKVRHLEQQIKKSITYTFVPREQNSRADFFVNRALDGLMS